VLDSLWARLLESLSRKVPTTILDNWIRPCRLLAVEGDHPWIGAPNGFWRDWLVQYHLETLQSAAQECLGGHPRVSIVVDDTLAPPITAPRPVAPAPTGQRRVDGLDPRSTFDTFVVGSSNQFAQAAGQAVAELPSRAYNPLFIYAGVGLGKTHLLHAVGHQANRLFPGKTIVYLSSERFTNELIHAIRYDCTPEFRARYRMVDFLLVDDIHFLSGKERTQEEFFHTFNDLYESGKQIVVSSDSSPKDIPEIDERLRSRFKSGLIADIQPPDFETRVAILKEKAAPEGVQLDDDIAYLIASRIKSNVRGLEGSLTRMVAFCTFTGRAMSVDLTQEVLADLWGDGEKIITIELVQRNVCDRYGVKLSELTAKNRTKTVVFPRQVAMYLSRHLTHASLVEVGRAFGGKDHTTVLHAFAKIQALMQEDPTFRKTIEGLIQDIHP